MVALVVLAAGARTLVVDTGFRGARGQGVPPCGAMDLRGLALVNGLVGNLPGTAALEVALTAPVLRAEGGALRLGLSGGMGGRITGTDGAVRVAGAWQTLTLAMGETLHLDPPQAGGLGLIGIAGGITLPPIMGSRTTSLRAGFGGMRGRALVAGDRLPCVAAPDGPDRMIAPPAPATGPLRVVIGPQAEWFAGAGQDLFLTTGWTVTPQTDRMGMRLDGPAIAFAPGRGADITSDGIAPGAIQVPGNGRPIILLADAQTTGGYAKIATVIRADLPRLAGLLPGDRISFRAVTVAEAEAATRAAHAAIAAAIAGIRPLTRSGNPDLSQANLAGAAVDARLPDHFPGHVEKEPG